MKFPHPITAEIIDNILVGCRDEGLEYELYSDFTDGSLTEDDIFDTLLTLISDFPGNPEDELIAEHIGNLYSYLVKHNAWLDDVIISNFGVRKNNPEIPVLRDLGALKI